MGGKHRDTKRVPALAAQWHYWPFTGRRHRPGELRHAEWAKIDLEGALWTIPDYKMKMRTDHLVPLSRQAVEFLEDAKAFFGPDGSFFRLIRTRLRPMSDNTNNAGLRRLGYTSDEMTGHGFRAMASPLLNESGNGTMVERLSRPAPESRGGCANSCRREVKAHENLSKCRAS